MLEIVIERAATESANAEENDEALEKLEIDRNSNSKLIKPESFLLKGASNEASCACTH